MKYDFSHMGENIASLRRASGLTQELLADRLGVTSQAVSKWERQLSCPDVSLLPAMADVFGVAIDDLFVRMDDDTDSRIDTTVSPLRYPTWNPFENILAPLGGKFACGEVCEGSKTSQNFQKALINNLY